MEVETLVSSRTLGVSLRAAIRAADGAYRAGQGYLSDAEFDGLVLELLRLDPTAPELLAPGGGNRLLSLDKQDLSEWLAGLGAAAAGRFSVTPKLDGCAIALQYRKGQLTAAWTRSGADALHLLSLVATVPHALAAPICAQIRGELYGLDGKQSTPAAALRRKVPSGQGLVFAGFELIHSAANHVTQLLALERWGLPVPPYLVCGGSELDHHHHAWLQGRLWSELTTEGLVVQLDDGQQRRKLGANSVAPNYALALKR